MAARALLSEATWSQCRHLATFHIDLKAKTWKQRTAIHNTLPRQWSFFCVVLLYQEGFSIVSSVEFNRFCIVFWVWLMIILVFVMLLRAKTSFSQNGGWSRFSFVFMLIALPISLKWSPCLCLVQQYGRRDFSLQRFISIQRTCSKRSKIHNKTLRQWWLFCVVLLYCGLFYCYCYLIQPSFYCFGLSSSFG